MAAIELQKSGDAGSAAMTVSSNLMQKIRFYRGNAAMLVVLFLEIAALMRLVLPK